MAELDILWDLDDDPHGNVQHIAQHGLTKNEVADVLDDPEGEDVSRSSRQPIVFGRTRHGDRIAVVYEQVDKTRCIQSRRFASRTEQWQSGM